LCYNILSAFCRYFSFLRKNGGISTSTPIYQVSDLFDLSHTIAAPLFAEATYGWDVLDGIKTFILHLGETLDPTVYEKRAEGVWIARDASVAPTAFIGSPCIIDRGAEIRHCAFIRGAAIIGRNAVLGNSCEIKNAILFDNVQVPHFNYVGDSILGYKSHMGAGSVTSNVKSDKTPVSVKSDDTVIATGRKKLGSLLGDFVEIGCNSVLCPGSVIGRNSIVYPLSRVRGVVPADSIFKSPDCIVPRK